MLGLKAYSQFIIYFTIYVRSQVAYQKYSVAAVETMTTPLAANKDLRFCIENQQTSMTTTLKTFWQDSQTECELDVKRLIELYSKLMLNANTDTDTDAIDHCNLLISHQIRKNVMKVMIAKIEEAFIAHSWASSAELKQSLKELYDIDKRVAQYILNYVFNEVYLFLEPVELIKDIVALGEKELQIMALNCLLNKYLLDNQQTVFSVLPLLTFHINQLYEQSFKSLTTSAKQALESLYHHLPEELRMFYESSKQRIGLLNQGHWEYLYAPRDNGPDNERRLALTWTQDKNTTDSDGHLTVSFNSNGLVSFGSRYGTSIKYLYADIEHQSVYFWLGTVMKSSQWWHVIWPHATFSLAGQRYLMFRNDNTLELLCATTAYDENRRYVTLLSGKDNMDNAACHWQVTRF